MLRVDDDGGGDVRVLVAAGTSTRRLGIPHVLIDDKCRTGRCLQLRGPTYFYASYFAIVRVAELEPLPGRCAPEILFKLLELLDPSP